MSVTRSFSRMASLRMIAQSSLSSVESAVDSPSTSIDPRIDPSGFRISCASPAAMRPSTASRSASSARALASSSAPPARRRRSERYAASTATTRMPSPFTSSG